MSNNMSNNVKKIAYAGVVAALYVSMTLVGVSFAFGPIQFRFAEVLCILPFFFPASTAGLFVGCLIANLLSPYGLLDIIAGPIATLIAALMTMRIGQMNSDSVASKALACFPPVIVNAVIIGAVIAWSGVGSGEAFWAAFAVNGLQVGLGQFAVMYSVGLPLMIYLPKTHLLDIINSN